MIDENEEVERIELLIKNPLIKYLKENKPTFKVIENDMFQYEFRWGKIIGQAFMDTEDYKWAIEYLAFNPHYDNKQNLLKLNNDNTISYVGIDDELLFTCCEREFWCWESGEALESIKDIAKILKIEV